MSTWQSIEVLDLVEHNRSEPLEEVVRRRFSLLDTRTGHRRAIVPTRAPDPARAFHWTSFTRAQVASMRAFVDARRGMAVPFWLPSWQADLSLAADVGSGAVILTVRRMLYARLLFPGTAGRRHLAFHRRGQALLFAKVTAATDPGSGATETLTVTPAIGANLAAAATTIMFLKLCRLEDDEAEITWLNSRMADTILRVREVPTEAPT